MLTPLHAAPVDSSRETLLYEMCVERVFGRPYGEVRREALAKNACDEVDLLNLGRQVFLDLPRLARGEISRISVPNRLPKRGEFARPI